MRKRLVMTALLAAGVAAMCGTSAPDKEEVLATSGAQIRVIKADKGVILEVAWSGGSKDDIGVLGILDHPGFGNQVYEPFDEIRSGRVLVWHAGASGTQQIHFISQLTGSRTDLACYAAFTIVHEELGVDVYLRPHTKTTSPPPHRRVMLNAEAIGTTARVLRPESYGPSEDFGGLKGIPVETVTDEYFRVDLGRCANANWRAPLPKNDRDRMVMITTSW